MLKSTAAGFHAILNLCLWNVRNYFLLFQDNPVLRIVPYFSHVEKTVVTMTTIMTRVISVLSVTNLGQKYLVDWCATYWPHV